MHKQGSVPRQAVEYDFLQNTPTRLLWSSERAAWCGLLACGYHVPAGDQQLCVPAATEDFIHVLLHGAVALQGKLVQRFPWQPVQVGDMALVPHGESSEWEQTGGPFDLLHLHLDPTLLVSTALEALDLDPARIELVPRVPIAEPLVYQISLALISELQRDGLIGRLYTDSLIQTLAVHLLRHHAVFPPHAATVASGLPLPTLRLVLDYINDNLASDLTLAELAALANISAYHFTRLFKQSIGQSLHQYVIARRVEKAKELLLVGRYTIAEVAAQVGFAHQSHLHRHFKRKIGVTPKQLIEQSKYVQKNGKNVQDSTDPVG